jgi:hypothetical protein
MALSQRRPPSNLSRERQEDSSSAKEVPPGSLLEKLQEEEGEVR